MALELRQGYTREEYCLPPETFENPNDNIKLPNLALPAFFNELSRRVWDIFEPQLQGLLPETH
jgi:aldehyde:ferredoxin oxidoreductase